MNVIAAISKRVACSDIQVFDEHPSTNEQAAFLAGKMADDAFARPLVVIADRQTAGRGRSGRSWHSPAGNVYLSVALRPNVAPSALPPLALVAGLVVARVVDQRLATARARIKWPNDVLVDGKKIAGVLVEGQIRGSHVRAVVIGVGVNVVSESFPPEIADRATSLAVLGARCDRDEILADLVAGLVEAVTEYERTGLAALLDEIDRRDAVRGTRVAISGVTGIAEGVAPDGRLRVRSDDGTVHLVASGDVI